MCGAIKYGVCSGVKGIYTAHGESIENLLENPIYKKMIDFKLFQRIIFLSNNEKGKIQNIYNP